MKTNKILLTLGFVATSLTSFAQVGVGTTSPDASAALDIESTTKGFLPPRMTKTQMDDIVSPAEGLMVYCLNCVPKGLYISNGTKFLNNGGNEASTNASGTISGNATATGATISVSGCAAVPGATLNDDATTTAGTEYDWSVGAAYLANGTTSRALVEIGGQCWYRINADKIPTTGEGTHVVDVDTGWNGYYTGGPFANEGRLYQWSAAMNGSTTERAQGICAPGFHVPSDAEWMYLENTLGMSTVDQQLTGFRSNPATGESQGSFLSTLTPGDTPTNKNKSGFTGLFSGHRNPNSTFNLRASNADWWSSSASGASTFARTIDISNRGVLRSAVTSAYGLGIRCLKD